MLLGRNATVLNFNPLVATIDGFLTPEECAALIAMADGRLERAPVYDVDDLENPNRPGENRTNTHAPVPRDASRLTRQICMMLALNLRLPVEHAEGIYVLHYAPGERFEAHPDGFDLDGPKETVADLLAMGGQRLFTSIIYLNEVEAGGTTSFPALKLRVAPAPGRLLIFANTLAGTNQVTPLAEHAGDPVTAGEKWAATIWWRENPSPSLAAD